MKHLLSIILSLLSLGAVAQEGRFLDIYAIGHQSSIDNQFDLRYGFVNGLGRDFDYKPSYHYGFGAFFSQTNETLIGYKTGIVFANYFQNIESRVELNRDEEPTSYTAQFRNRLLSVPFLIDFGINATDDDRVFFHMGFGLKPMILVGGDFEVNQSSSYVVSTDYNIYDYYKAVTISYLLNAELKINLGRSDKTYLVAGINFDKSIGGIEHKKTDHGGDVPRELVFPLGALKDYDYDVSADRAAVNTKNESLAVRIGISYRLSH